MASRSAERIARRAVDKVADRRSELAAAALKTLAELGYARTSLREIAQNSEFSHGVLHYYFRDKVDLITYCVRQYKAQCVTRYDELVADARVRRRARRRVPAQLAETLVDDADLHRLWYDLRSQCMFEESFRADVRHRPEPGADDLADRLPLRRARRAPLACLRHGLRDVRRAVPAGAAPPARR